MNTEKKQKNTHHLAYQLYNPTPIPRTHPTPTPHHHALQPPPKTPTPPPFHPILTVGNICRFGLHRHTSKENNIQHTRLTATQSLQHAVHFRALAVVSATLHLPFHVCSVGAGTGSDHLRPRTCRFFWKGRSSFTLDLSKTGHFSQ